MPSESVTAYGIDDAIGSTLSSSPWFTEPAAAMFVAPVTIIASLMELAARAGEAALLVTSVYTSENVPAVFRMSTYVSLEAVN